MPIGDIENGVLFDVDAIRNGARQLCQANGITTQAQWNTFIDGRTDAQLLVLLRSYFKTLIRIF